MHIRFYCQNNLKSQEAERFKSKHAEYTSYTRSFSFHVRPSFVKDLCLIKYGERHSFPFP